MATPVAHLFNPRLNGRGAGQGTAPAARACQAIRYAPLEHRQLQFRAGIPYQRDGAWFFDRLHHHHRCGGINQDLQTVKSGGHAGLTVSTPYRTITYSVPSGNRTLHIQG